MASQDQGESKTSIPASPPGKDGTWEVVEEVSDEFDGTFDATKWDNFNATWPGREPGWFNPDNVSVSDGSLQLVSKVEEPPDGYDDKYHTFSTAFVRSKTMVKYGYFEVSVKPADSITSSAFWFVRNDSDDWNEIDVFELSTADGHENSFHSNAHVFRKDGVDLDPTLNFRNEIKLSFPVSDTFTVGLEWNEHVIEWSINGVVKRSLSNDYWHQPMFVQFDSETMANWFGLPDVDDDRLPATYKIFYIRVWKKTSDESNELPIAIQGLP